MILTITLWVLVANTLTFGKVNSVPVYDGSILVLCQSADLQKLKFLLVTNKGAVNYKIVQSSVFVVCINNKHF